MTADEYLAGIVNQYRVPTGPRSPGAVAAGIILPVIQSWAGSVLNGVSYSGSYAKGTAIRGCSDVDIFISIKNECTMPLADIYESLFRTVRDAGYSVRRQNVSIGTEVNGVRMDLVPGRQQPGSTNDHSLYLSKRRSWTKTNVTVAADQIANPIDGVVSVEILSSAWRSLLRVNNASVISFQ